MEHEFDLRGEWAMGLDREIHLKDETIRSLQRELAELREVAINILIQMK